MMVPLQGYRIEEEDCGMLTFVLGSTGLLVTFFKVEAEILPPL